MSETPDSADEAIAERRYTVAVDCDGVLHSYTSGWQGADVLPDPPVEGAIEFLREVDAAGYDIAILTTRAREEGGAAAVEAYLREHGYNGPLVVTCEKLPALIYVDDRGWRFSGRFPSIRQIRYMRPWRTGDPARRPASVTIAKRGQEIQMLARKQTELKRKESEMKLELRRLRRELLVEVLGGRGLTPTAIESWMRAHAEEPFEDRLAAARAEPVR